MKKYIIGIDADEIFDKAEISRSERAENLTVDQFARITDVLSESLCSAKIKS